MFLDHEWIEWYLNIKDMSKFLNFKKKRLLKFGEKEMPSNLWYVFLQADPNLHEKFFSRI